MPYKSKVKSYMNLDPSSRTGCGFLCVTSCINRCGGTCMLECTATCTVTCEVGAGNTSIDIQVELQK